MKKKLYRIVLVKGYSTYTYEYYSSHRAYSKANFDDFLSYYRFKYGNYTRYTYKDIICNYIV